MELAVRVSTLEKAAGPVKDKVIFADQAAVPKRNEVMKGAKELAALIRLQRDKPPIQKLTIITHKETKAIEYLSRKYHPANDSIKMRRIVQKARNKVNVRLWG